MTMIAPMVTHGSASPGQPELARVDTNKDGGFEFAAVETGDWRLTAIVNEDEMPSAGAVSASVRDKDIEGLELRLTHPFVAPIAVDWGDRTPPKSWEIVSGSDFVSFQPLEGLPRPAVGAGDRRAPGVFGGRYQVGRRLEVPRGFYIAAVMLGGRDVLGQAVELAPGVGPFVAVLKHDPGSLRGMVENGEGGSVFLVPRPRGRPSIISPWRSVSEEPSSLATSRRASITWWGSISPASASCRSGSALFNRFPSDRRSDRGRRRRISESESEQVALVKSLHASCVTALLYAPGFAGGLDGRVTNASGGRS